MIVVVAIKMLVISLCMCVAWRQGSFHIGGFLGLCFDANKDACSSKWCSGE